MATTTVNETTKTTIAKDGNKSPARARENNAMSQGHKLRPQRARRLVVTCRRPIITGEEWYCYRVTEALKLVKALNKLS